MFQLQRFRFCQKIKSNLPPSFELHRSRLKQVLLNTQCRFISNEQFEALKPPGVTLIRDRTKAKQVATQLNQLTNCYHACDTEVIDLDLDRSPVGQGKVKKLNVIR